MAKAVAVVQLVAAGQTVNEACKLNFITVAGYRALLKAEPMLQAMNDEALSVRNEIFNDMLINIDKHHSDSKMAAVISKNIQWVLERNEPEKFAARLIVDPNNEATKLLAEALNKAIDRVPQAPGAKIPLISDATFETVEPKKRPPVGGTDGQLVLGEIREAAPATLTPLDQLKALGFV